MNDRERIVAELVAITPEPWTVTDGHFVWGRSVIEFDRRVCEAVDGNRVANARFIANAPANIRLLLDANDALRTALIEAQSWIEGPLGDGNDPSWLERVPLAHRIRAALSTATDTGEAGK